MIERRDATSNGLNEDRFVRALTSAFFATVLVTSVLVVAFWLASLIGSSGSPDASPLTRWSYGLTHNPITDDVRTNLPLALLLHIVAGVGWGLVYAFLAEPRLSGPGWRRGAIFSLAPWILSLLVFLPVVGGGILGLALNAGPLPIIGNLILHLVYGATLGSLYVSESDRPISERGHGQSDNLYERFALANANRTMASGIVLGLIFGAVVGLVAGVTFVGGSPFLALVFGAMIGSALGAVAGSMWGLSPKRR